jgi:hypothetical protein
MVSAVAALMAAMMALMAAPAMALDLDSNDDFVFFGHNDDDDDFGDFFGFDNDDDDFDDFFGFDGADGFAVDNEAESGAVDLSFGVSNTGDYASQCVPATQFGNSGNFNNAPTFAQFGSGGFVDDERNDFGFFNDGDLDDFEPGGIEFSVSPEVAVDCSNTIQQSSAADSSWWY